MGWKMEWLKWQSACLGKHKALSSNPGIAKRNKIYFNVYTKIKQV
jgi:hypothetical protein